MAFGQTHGNADLDLSQQLCDDVFDERSVLMARRVQFMPALCILRAVPNFDMDN